MHRHYLKLNRIIVYYMKHLYILNNDRFFPSYCIIEKSKFLLVKSNYEKTLNFVFLSQQHPLTQRNYLYLHCRITVALMKNYD